MIKIASRKIFPPLPHASMLIDVDIYLNVGSTCKTVLVLSRNLAMCSVAIEVIFFPHWWDRILNKHNVTGWRRYSLSGRGSWHQAFLWQGEQEAAACSNLIGSGSGQKKGWNQERAISPHPPHSKWSTSPSLLPSSSGPTSVPKSTT